MDTRLLRRRVEQVPVPDEDLRSLPGETVAYDLAPTMLHRGMNTVEVKLVSEEPSREGAISLLHQIRVEVRYE